MFRSSFILVLATIFPGGCSSSEPPETPAPREVGLPDLGPSPPWAGGLPDVAVSIQGVISLIADPPPPRRRYPWPYSNPPLKKIPPGEDCVLDGNNRVRWAFVTISKGVEPQSFEGPKDPVQIQIARYRFWPHIVGVRAGQDFRIVNNNDDLHNVHALSFTNREFNVGLRARNTDTVRRFQAPEVMIKVMDSVHPWMCFWIGVVDHPYFAVTGPDGRYELRGLPPGKYTLTMWQEQFKSIDRQIEVTNGEPRTENFALDTLKQ